MSAVLNEQAIGGGVRLEVRGVHKRYGEREVLRNTQITVEPGQFIAMGFDGIRQRQQGLRAVLGAGLRPAVEGLVGGAHGAVHLGLGGFVDLCQRGSQRRVEHGPGRALASDQLAIDQHLRLHRELLQGHLPLPATLSPPRVR